MYIMVQINCPVLWIAYAPAGFCRLIVKNKKSTFKLFILEKDILYFSWHRYHLAEESVYKYDMTGFKL